MSDEFQIATQLALGTLIVSLFSFVGDLRFRQSCLATIFFVAAMLLVASNAHIGSRLAGSALILGGLWFGALLSAAAISLARLCTGAYTTALIIFTCLGLLMTTALRVKANLGVGIVSNLGFGIMLISGQFVWPAATLWGHIYTAVLRIGVVAALGVFVAGLFVLPSLSGDALRKRIAFTLRDLGKVISEDAGHLLLRRQDEEGAMESSTKEQRRNRAITARKLNLTFQDESELDALSKPGQDRRPLWTRQKGVITMTQLRPSLAKCRELFMMSVLEPAFLRWGGLPYHTFRWPPVMSALETLMMRVAALETIIEGEDPMMLDSELNRSLGLELLPAFSLMFAQIAACCASAGAAVFQDAGFAKGGRLLFEPSWALIEYEVAGALHKGLKCFWHRVQSETPKDFVNPTPEIRALMFIGTVGTSIMEAMAAFERALKHALHSHVALDEEDAAEPVMHAIQALRNAAAGEEAVNIIRAPPFEPPAVNVMIDEDISREQTAAQDDIAEAERSASPRTAPARFASFSGSMSKRPMQRTVTSSRFSQSRINAKEKALEEKAAPKKQASDWFQRHFVWAIPLVKAAFAWDVVGVVQGLLMKDIPQEFSTPRKMWHTFRKNRWFQFGLKYFAASALVLAVLLGLQANYKGTRSWNGLYVYITVVVVLCEKVDTTFQKGMMRVITTVIGGVLGYLVMLDTGLATNPYALAVISTTFAFLCGFLALGPLKYAIFLTVITYDGVVLCQYDGIHKGSHKNFYTRLVVTVWGVLLCLAFDLLFPWYAASSAIQSLGAGFEATGEILREFTMIMAEELELAYLHGEDPEAAAEKTEQGVRRLEKGILQRRIAQPLGGVQVSLEKEGVLWRTGVLAMPLIVRQCIQLMQAILDRLVAVELMLLQKPIVSGRYSGSTWFHLHRHMQPTVLAVSDAIHEMCAATAGVMAEFPSEDDMKRLHTAIDAALASRLRFRTVYRERLTKYLDEIREGPEKHPLVGTRSIDDGIRYQSLVFAVGKALDKMLLLARTVVDDPWMRERVYHPHRWQTWRTWIGKYGY